MGGSWERLIGVSRRILDNILYDNRHHKLTHEVLSTFLAETMAIMNSRPLVPISSDHESPCVLSPNVLLTQKTNSPTDDFSYLHTKDVYTKQWKFVQVMADRFWTQWRQEYLQTLQSRRKWEKTHMNIQVNDVVILNESDLHRNMWPIGIVEQTFPGKDGLILKVQLKVIRELHPSCNQIDSVG